MSKVEQLITEHIDIWTSAILAKSTAGRGSNKKYELYGIKKLRELILELAVRGKLVPQDSSDEPASVLLERIAAEKAKLIKEGRVKKSKPLPEIGEDEKPFELPQGWEWCRLQDVGHDWGQKKPDKNFTYIDVGSINKEFGLIGEASVLSAKEAPSRARKLVKKGTVIYSTVRPYLLNIAIVDQELEPEPIASTAFAIIHPLEGMSSSFIYRYLRSPSFVSYVENCQTGVAYPAINDKQFFAGLIPVPPAIEQVRIVAKVDELMLLCDQLEQQTETSIDAHATLVEVLLATLTDSADANELAQNWARVSEHFATLFTTEQSIEALKQTLLQLAVMGKLVPQDPDDEPAAVLLEKIAAEKAQLIKDKKIRAEKPLPAIKSEEKNFELPRGWELCRFGEITFNRDAERIPLSVDVRQRRQGPYDYYGASGVIDNIDDYLFDEPLLLIGEDGANLINRSTPIAFIARGKYWVNNHAHVVGGVSEVFLIYLCTYINAITLEPYITGTAQPKMNQAKMNTILISLPPHSEQYRIVEKLNELISICDQLKTNLQQSQETQVQLTDALIDQALVQ